MVSLTLDSLPVELIEEVASRLDFHDLCALRLTGRTVSSKSSNATFRNYFLSKKLELAEAPLEQFVLVTKPGRSGLCLQQLTLYASIEPPISEDASTGGMSPVTSRVVQLLARGFQNMRDYSPQNNALSVSLKVLGKGHKKELAAKILRVTMAALGSTGLPIHSFDVFTEGYSHTRGGFCSFPIGEITEALPGGNTADLNRLAMAFQPCNKICLSLAHHVLEFSLHQRRHIVFPQSYEEARDHTRSLCDLLTLCPTLEELHLVWEYDPVDERTAGVLEELYFFRRVAESCQFPRLEKCTLHNLRMTEATLLTFFRQLTRLEHLDLRSIFLQGEFDGLFRLLSTEMPELRYLRLQGLYSSTGTLRFLNEPPENRLRNPRGHPSPGIIRRGAAARRPVVAKGTR
ncbi:hypothetical protein AtubIFM57258_006842 [Aspergillus tubingensis]|nr:hypothetical protein AtubIFM57258_006842 [Aspergillus tubingensis]